jgi:molybdate transport system regulatory protein
MKTSARNKFKGTIRKMESDSIMAELTIEIKGKNYITSIITNESANELGLAIGDEIEAMVKSTSVIISK